MKKLLTIFVLFVSILGNGQSLDSLFNAGVERLSNESYEKAIVYFEKYNSIEAAPEVYFNLGNAYLKLNDLAMARASFESALKLAPNYKKAELAAQNVFAEIKENTIWQHPIPAGLRFFMKFSSTFWTIFLLILNIVISLLLFKLIKGKISSTLKLRYIFSVTILLILNIVFVFANQSSKKITTSKTHAIVINDISEVFASPNGVKLDTKPIYGRRFNVIELKDEWVKLSFLDEAPVWINLNDIVLF